MLQMQRRTRHLQVPPRQHGEYMPDAAGADTKSGDGDGHAADGRRVRKGVAQPDICVAVTDDQYVWEAGAAAAETEEGYLETAFRASGAAVARRPDDGTWAGGS